MADMGATSWVRTAGKARGESFCLPFRKPWAIGLRKARLLLVMLVASYPWRSVSRFFFCFLSSLNHWRQCQHFHLGSRYKNCICINFQSNRFSFIGHPHSFTNMKIAVLGIFRIL